MAVVVNASLAGLGPNSSLWSPHSLFSSIHSPSIPPALHFSRKRALSSCTFALKKSNLCVNEEKNVAILDEPSETLLYSFSPLSLLLFAALPGATTVTSLFSPFVELVKSWSLPDWLVHWGHPGNMAVVLFAMGGYGTYLSFRIRFSNDVEEKAKAKDLHPKLLAGMFFFFALGASHWRSYISPHFRQAHLRKPSCCNRLHRSCSFDNSDFVASTI